MGAWDLGIYDNDTAADWVHELIENDPPFLLSLLVRTAEADYVDSYDGACALVAADVVARCKNNDGEDTAYADGVDEWVAKHKDAELRTNAQLAVQAVRNVRWVEKSELAELWDANNDGGESLRAWTAKLDELINRLS